MSCSYQKWMIKVYGHYQFLLNFTSLSKEDEMILKKTFLKGIIKKKWKRVKKSFIDKKDKTIFIFCRKKTCNCKGHPLLLSL